MLSGCSATSFLTRSVCGASTNVLWPPNLAGLTLPVSRLRLMNPPTVLKAKLYKLGNFFVGVPGFNRRDGAFTQVAGVSLRHS